MNARQLNVVESLLNEHQSIKDTVIELEEKMTQLKGKIFSYLEDNSLETLEVGEEGAVIRVTIVRPTTLKIDEAGLEQVLTKPQWKLVTKQVVDKKALEDAMVRGKIDTNIVADQTKEVASKPYLRITG